MFRNLKSLLCGITILMLSGVLGCTLGPDYQRPELNLPENYRELSSWKEAAPADDIHKGEWWTLYNDPVLDQLQQQAMEANQTLQAALARLDQARASARISEAGLYPRIDLDPSAQRSRYAADLNNGKSVTVSTFRLPLDLSYEIDLWGRVRRSIEADTANYQASIADMQNIMLTLQAEVARNYFALRTFDSQVDLLQRTTDLRQKNLQLVNSLFKNGQVGRLDVARAETELANAQADLSALKRQRTAAEHALAVLAGLPPANFSLPAAHESSMHLPTIQAGIPSDLLERRPDIASAERRMMAANARIGIAKAAFFPSLSLTGAAGYASQELQNLFDSDNRTWAIGPFISLPIFDGGRNRARLALSEAAWQEDVANYRQQLLVAFREVEDALSDIRILEEQAEAQQRAHTAAKEAASISAKRYRAGMVSYLEVVVSERTALANELLTTHVRGQRLQASISLIKALGGGWSSQGEEIPEN